MKKIEYVMEECYGYHFQCPVCPDCVVKMKRIIREQTFETAFICPICNMRFYNWNEKENSEEQNSEELELEEQLKEMRS
jgi:hypothetical protein